MKRKLSKYGIITLISLSFSHVGFAEDWSGYADVSVLAGTYSGTTTRTDVNAYGGSVRLDYLERAGVKLAGSQLTITDNGNAIVQNSAFASGYLNYFSDRLGGVLKFRLDIHQANLSDDFIYQDSVQAYAPQISFLNYAKNLYLDLGYSVSTYDLGLETKQFTPTLGFAFNGGSDWLQTRGYLIDITNTINSSASSTKAVEFKLTHWTAPNSVFAQFFVNVLAGGRILAVDGDAAAIYSLVDKQQGGGSIGAAWQSHYVDGMVMLSADKYLDPITNGSYINSLVYLNMSKSW